VALQGHQLVWQLFCKLPPHLSSTSTVHQMCHLYRTER
jgi:hypothetical protein